jgi:hypothetical protein
MHNKRKLLMIIIYFLGFITPFFVMWILLSCGVDFPKSNKNKIETALSKWRIDECNETFLYTNVPAEPNVMFAIGIHRDPNTKLLQRIGIVKYMGEQEKCNAIFLYEAKGKYGTSTAYYGSPGGEIIWRDFNFDGIFDQRDDYISSTIAINLGGVWVPGRWMSSTEQTDISTEKGIFRFDPNAGEWRYIAAIPKSEN